MTSARSKRTEEKIVEISLASSMMPQPTFTRERDISTERHAWYAALSEIARLHHDYNLTRPRIYGNASVALSHWKPFHHKQIWSVHHTLSGIMFSRKEQSQYEIMSFHYNDQSPFQYIKTRSCSKSALELNCGNCKLEWNGSCEHVMKILTLRMREKILMLKWARKVPLRYGTCIIGVFISSSWRQHPYAMCIKLLVPELVRWTQTICIESICRIKPTDNIKSQHIQLEKMRRCAR